MTEIQESGYLIIIGESIPDANRAAAFVNRDDCGAVNVFEGVTRSHEAGKQVVTLYYDCYEEMAVAELKKLIAAIREEFAAGKIAVFHRIGEVPIGETSMIVAVSAPHRREAVHGTLELIDRLKQEVPIWKKERFTDGELWKEEQKNYL